jgi:membrane protease YdiL (CAAX protease family)
LFFRGYLEKRLRLGSGIAWMIVAAVVTAALFAALHDRWAEAFVASLAFSWAAQRNGRVTDAILSHAVANAVVFGAAVATGNLAII